MHSVNPALSRSSSAMRSSILSDHVPESLAQSRLVGARSGGSFASSEPISSRDRPTLWAKTMNAIRLSTVRGYLRCPEPARSELISPFSS